MITIPTAEAKTSGLGKTGLVTLDYVDQLLAELTAEGEKTGTPTSVVLLELDAADAAADGPRSLAGRRC